MTYADKVYQQLNNLEPGQKISIDPNLPYAANYIELVKEYIQAHKFGNGIEFCGEYTIRKMNMTFSKDYKALRKAYKLKPVSK